MNSKLQHTIEYLLDVQTEDGDTRRRGQSLIVLAVLLSLFLWIASPIPLIVQGSPLGLALMIGVPFVLLGAAWLARSGRVTLAAYVMVFTYAAAFAMTVLPVRRLDVEAFLLSFMVMTAGLVLAPFGVIIVTLLCLALIVLFGVVVISMPQMGLSFEELIVYGLAVAVFTGLHALINAMVSRHATQQLVGARQQAEESKAQLEDVNASLEERIAIRTSELRATVAALEHRSQELSAALQEQQRLSQQVQELVMPIIPIRKDAVVVPLIGALEKNMTSNSHNRVLKSVEQQRASYLILDVTGVSSLDRASAATLLEIAMAVQLLGGRTKLVGVRPEVAEALVSIDADLRMVETAATLQQAIEQLPPLRSR